MSISASSFNIIKSPSHHAHPFLIASSPTPLKLKKIQKIAAIALAFLVGFLTSPLLIVGGAAFGYLTFTCITAKMKSQRIAKEAAAAGEQAQNYQAHTQRLQGEIDEARQRLHNLATPESAEQFLANRHEVEGLKTQFNARVATLVSEYEQVRALSQNEFLNQAEQRSMRQRAEDMATRIPQYQHTMNVLDYLSQHRRRLEEIQTSTADGRFFDTQTDAAYSYNDSTAVSLASRLRRLPLPPIVELAIQREVAAVEENWRQFGQDRDCEYRLPRIWTIGEARFIEPGDTYSHRPAVI